MGNRLETGRLRSRTRTHQGPDEGEKSTAAYPSAHGQALLNTTARAISEDIRLHHLQIQSRRGREKDERTR